MDRELEHYDPRDEKEVLAIVNSFKIAVVWLVIWFFSLKDSSAGDAGGTEYKAARLDTGAAFAVWEWLLIGHLFIFLRLHESFSALK